MLMAPPQVGTSTLSLYCTMVYYGYILSSNFAICPRIHMDSEFSAGDGLILGLPIWVSWSWGIADGCEKSPGDPGRFIIVGVSTT